LYATDGAFQLLIFLFDASAVTMLALFRVPVEAALTATLLFRGLSCWLPMAPGFWLSRREIKGKVATRT
jgi:hypothetical protein